MWKVSVPQWGDTSAEPDFSVLINSSNAPAKASKKRPIAKNSSQTTSAPQTKTEKPANKPPKKQKTTATATPSPQAKKDLPSPAKPAKKQRPAKAPSAPAPPLEASKKQKQQKQQHSKPSPQAKAPPQKPLAAAKPQPAKAKAAPASQVGAALDKKKEKRKARKKLRKEVKASKRLLLETAVAEATPAPAKSKAKPLPSVPAAAKAPNAPKAPKAKLDAKKAFSKDLQVSAPTKTKAIAAKGAGTPKAKLDSKAVKTQKASSKQKPKSGFVFAEDSEDDESVSSTLEVESEGSGPEALEFDEPEPQGTYLEKLQAKLKGSRFRWLNEKLYTISGSDALSLFQENPDLFDVYHEGYRSQVTKWPVNPLDVIIKWLRKQPQTLVVADFGCGEAKLAQSVKQKVHSFDLHPVNSWVTVADSANVPLKAASVDVAVFCLSLMGVNFVDFLTEANRVLRPGGTLKVAEVKSRFATGSHESFVSILYHLGFDKVDEDVSNVMFVTFEFKKSNRPVVKKSYLARSTILSSLTTLFLTLIDTS